MGCLSFKLSRIGGGDASLTRVGGHSMRLEDICDIDASLTMVDGDYRVSLKKKGGMACRMGLVCRTNIRVPYLEIAPTIIWVYPDIAVDNEVYSNTHWNVN